MGPINVAINGVLGKMGREVLNTACREADLAPVGGADIQAGSDSLPLPDGSGIIPLSKKLEDVLADAHVVVDFAGAEGAMEAVRTAAPHKVNVVVGSSGLSDADLNEAESLAKEHQVGIVVAPNFALGAVVMVALAKAASRFFDYAELTEMHHEAKIDAPSGTALAIARAAIEGKGGPFIGPEAQKETLAGTRGGSYEGMNIHAGRMPGRMAHHELVFGTLGQTLTIRHDSINRESFMPGVVLAIREAVRAPGYTLGLETVLGL